MSSSKPFSYESLKTVIQHLDANKRIQIASKCDFLKKTERVVPLKIRHLEFGAEHTKVNETMYQRHTLKYMTELTIHTPSGTEIVYFKRTDFPVLIVMNFVLFYSRRNVIHIKTLSIRDGSIALPKGLNFKVRELILGAYFAENIAKISQVVLPGVHTLELMKPVRTLEDLSHPLERNATKLVLHINYYNDMWPFIIPKLPNREVLVKNDEFEMEQIMEIFRSVLAHWKEQGWEIGTCFSFEVQNVWRTDPIDLLKEACEPYGAVEIEEMNLKFSLNQTTNVHVTFEPSDIEDEGMFIYGIFRSEIDKV